MPAVAVGNPQAAAGKAPAVARAVAKGGHQAKAPAACSGSRPVTCQQEGVQGPRVTADGSSLSLLGPLPPGGPGFFTMDFFSAMTDCKGQWRQHNAALNWFRTRCEREGPYEGFALENSHVAAVAAIVHPRGEEYHFVEDDLHEWSWHEMVAQLDRASLEKVVQDGDPTRGLVGCEFRPRRNSSDHGPQSRLRDWDFLLVRSDNSAVRLHPDWKTTNIAAVQNGQVDSLRFSNHVTFV